MLLPTGSDSRGVLGLYYLQEVKREGVGSIPVAYYFLVNACRIVQ